MSKIELYNDDCFNILPNLVGVNISAVIVDLPYGTTQCKWDTPIDLELMWKQLYDIIDDRTPVIMFAQTPFDKVLGMSNIKNLKYEWIWEKTQATGHLNSKKMPMKAHENILVFYKKLPKYNPQKTSGHTPVHSFVKKKEVSDRYEGYGKNSCNVSGGGSTERYPRSVQVFSSDKQKFSLHPTQKPLALLEYLVKTYTDEGDTVLDFAMGSNTCGLACKNLNRNFIGVEKDLKYYKIAENRLRN